VENQALETDSLRGPLSAALHEKIFKDKEKIYMKSNLPIFISFL